jgi:hypothetical protein
MVDREALVGRWVHAHEEDSEGRTTFRPATTPLPPSRGRRILELHDDGGLVEVEPGAADVPEAVPGEWELQGQWLLLRHPAQGTRRMRIVKAEPERLVLRTAAEL